MIFPSSDVLLSKDSRKFEKMEGKPFRLLNIKPILNGIKGQGEVTFVFYVKGRKPLCFVSKGGNFFLLCVKGRQFLFFMSKRGGLLSIVLKKIDVSNGGNYCHFCQIVATSVLCNGALVVCCPKYISQLLRMGLFSNCARSLSAFDTRSPNERRWIGLRS